MKIKIKKICASVMSLTLFATGVAAAGCSKPENGGNAGDKTLNIYIWNDDGSTPDGFDDVLTYFNSTYGPELGFNVKFKFDTQSDYKQNLNLAMAANQKDYDMVFDAGWIYLNDFAKKKYYYDLSDYFKPGSGYDGLSSAFSSEYLSNNLFSGGVYGVPLTQTYGDISVAYIRKDWREACAADANFKMPDGKFEGNAVTRKDLADGIDSFDELQYYLYWVLANKQGVTPCLSNNDATWGAWDIINSRNKPSHSAQDYVNAGIKQEIKLTADVTATAYVRRGTVEAAYINDIENPTSENGMSSFPKGFDAEDTTWTSNFSLARRWAEDGIISKDVLQVTDSDAKFKAGMGGCVVQTINNFSTVEATLKQNNPGAELEIYVNEYALRNKLSGYAQTDYKAWNFLCVPTSAGEAKRDMAMKFLNWIFESEEHHDLFQYGIKGKHWKEVTDESGNAIEGTVETTGMESYTFPAYELTWNPKYIRVVRASDPKVMEYMKYMYDSSRYVGIIYSEFTFDHTATDALTTALSNADIANAKTEARSWYLGQVSDPVSSWQAKLTGRYENASLQSAIKVIKDELIRQLQDFIDKQ